MAVSANDINALLGGYTDLKAYYEGARGGIEARVSAALASIPETLKVYYVHQGSGADNAIGTQAAPLRSIKEAIRRTPAAGTAIVYLLSDYRFTESTPTNGVVVDIRGDRAAVQPKLTFAWVPSTIEPGKIRGMSGLDPLYDGRFRLTQCTIELPADPVEAFEVMHLRGFLTGSQAETPAFVSAKFTRCTFQLEANSTLATIFGDSTSLISVRFVSCTLPTAMKGRVQSGVGGEGVNPDTVIRKIITNLTWI